MFISQLLAIRLQLTTIVMIDQAVDRYLLHKSQKVVKKKVPNPKDF